MNKHQKLAVLIAPFLIVGGYVAADYYALAKEKVVLEQRAYQFILQKPCDLQAVPCSLKKGGVELELSVDVSSGQLKLISNYVLDGVTLALDSNKPKPLNRVVDNKNWQVLIESNSPRPSKLRLVTSINKQYYFADISLF